MVKKSQKNQPMQTRYALILSFALLMLTIGVIFIKAQYISQGETNGIASLKSDVQTLQSSFNKVESGWKYDEFCIGYGTDVARNNSITCYIEIENSNISGDINSKFITYSELLNKSGVYLKIGDNEVSASQNRPDKQNYVTKSVYKKYDSAVCELRTQAFVESENRGVLLSCSFKATKSYFERRD